MDVQLSMAAMHQSGIVGSHPLDLGCNFGQAEARNDRDCSEVALLVGPHLKRPIPWLCG